MRKTLSALALALALVPAAASAQQKIGYVDLQRAMNEIEEGKAVTAVLKQDFAEKQKQIDAKKAELEKLQAEFEKQATVMSEQARKDKAVDLDRRARDLQALFVSLQKDLSDRDREATRGVFDKMAQIVAEIAEADGFTIVLERNAGLVYAPPSLDLTNELIRKYNARHPGGAKKPEAGKKSEGAKKPEAAGKKPDAAKKAEGSAGKK
ncbi:MAG TPA: OmpH family outer membrane protein [Anaeromyxobacter sp.]